MARPVRTRDRPGWHGRRVRASWSSVLLALAALVAVLVARNLFIAASQPIGWVAASAAAAIVVAPIIDLQTRWVPRGVAIVVSLVVAIAVAVTVGAGIFFEVQDQLAELRERLPAAAARLEHRSGPESTAAQIDLSSLVGDLVDQASERVAPPSIEGAVGTVPAFLVSGVLMVFFLVWGDEMFEGLERQISSKERRRFGRRSVQHAVRVTQRYIIIAVETAAVVALAGAGMARSADLPTPLVLGVVLGAGSIIPFFGVLFGSVPLLLLSATFEPASTTILLALGVLVIQAGVTLATRAAERHTLRVGPVVIVLAVLVGSDLYGIGGALVAIVAAILAVALVDEVGNELST